MIVELNIFSFNEDQIKQKDMGYDIPLEECGISKYGFLTIDYITACRTNPKYCIIGCSEGEFVCNQDYNSVKAIIQQSQTFKFN
jgi:hypothetical protein